MSEEEARALVEKRIADAVESAPPLSPEVERRLRELLTLSQARGERLARAQEVNLPDE